MSNLNIYDKYFLRINQCLWIKSINEVLSTLQVGDHKNHLSKEQLVQFKAWTKEGLKGSDFPYYQDYD